LARTGSTVFVGLGAGVVVVDGAADVVVLDGGVVLVGPGEPAVQAPSNATARPAAAYGKSRRCGCGRAAAVIGVPCRSSIIVRLRALKGVSCPSFLEATYDHRHAPAS
jgi:hypothetical protein